MKYVIGFTDSSAKAPFHSYESDVPGPDFAVGSKIRLSAFDPGWLQVFNVGYQIEPETVVVTVVVGAATNLGGDGEELAKWPWA